LLLDKGLVVKDDAPDAVLDYYNAMIAAQEAEYEIRQFRAAGRPPGHPVGSSEAVIESVDLTSRGATPARRAPCRRAPRFAFEITVLARADSRSSPAE
jgi:lipopolysaccharide transport system ATP-binding protein